MSEIPASIFSKLYEQDSLRNTDDGFEVRFRNRLAPTTLIGVGPLSIDGEQWSGEQLIIQLERPREGHSRPPTPIVRNGKEISEKKPVMFGVNTVAKAYCQRAATKPRPLSCGAGHLHQGGR